MNPFDMLITTPLGYIISFIYSFVNNYGLTIILFTILIKAIMIPLSVKQQKSMVEMQRLKPFLDILQEKYKDDKERLNQETMKLYQEHKVNPAGGCLPMLLQFPIIIGLYQVILKPLQYIMHLPLDKVAQITELLGFSGTGKSEIVIAQSAAQNMDLISSELGIQIMPIDFNFLGLDLSLQPDFMILNVLWIIPILSAATAYLSTWVMQKLSGSSAQQAQQMKSMNIIMPLMSGYFCFIMPAGVGLYWIMSNVVQIIQQVAMNKILLKKKEEEEPLDVEEFKRQQTRKNRKKR